MLKLLKLMYVEIFIIIILLMLVLKFKNTFVNIITLITLFCILFFYRSHTGSFDMNKNVIMSPCNGKIIKIEENDTVYIIHVFLNLHNVHFQYMPYDGNILSVEELDGPFINASHDNAVNNKRLKTIIDTRIGQIIIYQISGMLVQKVISFVKPNQKVKKGEKIGYIKLGSRVIIYLPKNVILNKKTGDIIEVGDSLANIK